ncbi:putative lipoyltransferase 2, mitochondrial [Hypsibius exemplaris]|uniref:Octanoyl-[acyl-carrier-protein]:protein N-octanoyltransferase LIPT2, mitochondrial n=1 Tax=Hypsibius exemplaris TaxID=2072580 RepID=A0A1W0WD54_HYPEX|nr:putative lipoyltransferase 2, mitochondrial [Hypsibius exemplaris]
MSAAATKFAKILPYCNLGRMKYDKALTLQESLVQRQLSFSRNTTGDSPDNPLSSPDILLIVEHEPVYTVGIRSNEFTEIDSAVLQAKGADFHRTNRGGLITFHGPGQLVAYPILNLQRYKPSIRWYVCQLEEVLIRTCRHFGVESGRTENTGIWVERGKIAAIGLNCKKYITSHGLALNCDTDLAWFDGIVPCGLPGLGVTSLSRELGRTIGMAQVLPIFLQKFVEVFDLADVHEVSRDEVLRPMERVLAVER